MITTRGNSIKRKGRGGEGVVKRLEKKECRNYCQGHRFTNECLKIKCFYFILEQKLSPLVYFSETTFLSLTKKGLGQLIRLKVQRENCVKIEIQNAL